MPQRRALVRAKASPAGLQVGVGPAETALEHRGAALLQHDGGQQAVLDVLVERARRAGLVDGVVLLLGDGHPVDDLGPLADIAADEGVAGRRLQVVPDAGPVHGKGRRGRQHGGSCKQSDERLQAC